MELLGHNLPAVKWRKEICSKQPMCREGKKLFTGTVNGDHLLGSYLGPDLALRRASILRE